MTGVVDKQKRKPRVKEPLLAEIEFRKEYRCFKKGRKVTFQPGVNLLVGDQGTGKSTIIQLVNELAKGHKSAKETISVIAAGSPVFVFDFELESPRTKRYLEDGGTFAQFAFQMKAMTASHGETVNALLDQVGRKKPTLILLDEPDMALSPRSAHRLAAKLAELASAKHQVIAAVHNPIVIASQPKVFSLEHKRWVTSKTFLASHEMEV